MKKGDGLKPYSQSPVDVSFNCDEGRSVPICFRVQDFSSPHLDGDTFCDLASKPVLTIVSFALKFKVRRSPVVIFDLMVIKERIVLWLCIHLSCLWIYRAILMPFPALVKRYMLGTASEVVLRTLAVITQSQGLDSGASQPHLK